MSSSIYNEITRLENIITNLEKKISNYEKELLKLREQIEMFNLTELDTADSVTDIQNINFDDNVITVKTNFIRKKETIPLGDKNVLIEKIIPYCTTYTKE
ncbi:hypothetical protein RDV78_04745 [Bacillota bacterium LX-D]|nr:hypothetical protein [Bacillota bacterium LX-D]